MRKLFSLIKKIYLRLLIVCVVVFILSIILFLNSDAKYLVFRPTKPLVKNNNQPAKQVLGKRQKKFTPKSFLSHIRKKYGKIQFITHETIFTDDKNSNNGVKDIIKTSVPVPDSIRGIAGLNGAPYLDRMNAADALDCNLSVAEQKALLHFLHKRTSEDNLRPLDLNAVKNQVAIAMIRQLPVNKEFPLHLIAMYYENDYLDVTWRDYCIQFLGQCYFQIENELHKQLVRETLFKALDDKQNIAAPAIIAIDGLSKYSGFVDYEIALRAYELAADKDTADIVKIPAIQIAAKYKHPKALQLAKDMLTKEKRITSSNCPRQPKVPVILKMSAIATLGTYGNSNDIKLLKTYRNSVDIRLRAAAKSALNRIAKRIWEKKIEPRTG